MKKYIYHILVVMLTLIACNRHVDKETIDEFILYGHSGYCIKDSANWVYDSTKLDIRQYFEFKRDNYVRIAIRPCDQSMTYYSINSNDTLGLDQLLDTILINKSFEKDYYRRDKGLWMYTGYYYVIYFKTNKNRETFIHYLPDYLTPDLLVLHDYFINLLKRKPLIQSKTFELNEICAKEALDFVKPTPPPPEVIE